jgi:hypothetical protein
MREGRRVSVYFITCRTANAVKIGSSGDPHLRVREIQIGCPGKVRLEAILPGSIAEEKALHRRFADHRTQGEWFNITPVIEAMIAANPAKPKDVQGAPLSDAFIARAAEEFGVTRPALAERMGITITELTAYEQGRTMSPDVRDRLEYARDYYGRKQSKLRIVA